MTTADGNKCSNWSAIIQLSTVVQGRFWPRNLLPDYEVYPEKGQPIRFDTLTPATASSGAETQSHQFNP
jgi:hypothetical protein